MLERLEKREDKIQAQAHLSRLLRHAWKHRENRQVVWRPTSRFLDIAHNRNFWLLYT